MYIVDLDYLAGDGTLLIKSLDIIYKFLHIIHTISFIQKCFNIFLNRAYAKKRAHTDARHLLQLQKMKNG